MREGMESRNVKLPNWLWDKLGEISSERDMSKSKLIEKSLAYYLDRLPPMEPRDTAFSGPTDGTIQHVGDYL